jgi:hypothetical protein
MSESINENSQPEFISEIINTTFKKINSYPEGNALFYKSINLNRSTISSWRVRKQIPSRKQMAYLLAIAKKVITTCEENKVAQLQAIEKEIKAAEKPRSKKNKAVE